MHSLLFLCFIALSVAVRWNELDNYSFEDYEVEFSKNYESKGERLLRMKLFEHNLRNIKKHNADPTKSWKKGVNHLTDWTEQELSQIRGAFPKQTGGVNKPHLLGAKKYDVAELESRHVDWRNKRVVSPVKDQGKCGSCWAFATAAVVESYYALLTGQLAELSEQQILDCTPNPNECGGTGGCGGGTVELAFERIKKMGGLASEWTYPYVSYFGDAQKCKYNPSTTKPFANLTDFTTLPQNEYYPLLDHIAHQGPLAVSVDASTWSHYEEGVFDDCNLTNPDLNHAVVVEGYGVDEETGTPYWLIRNSWSPKWGEQGYIRLKRESAGVPCGEDLTPLHGNGCKDGPPVVKVCGYCGVLFDSTYPTVAPLPRK